MMAVRPLAEVRTIPFQGAFRKELALTDGWSWNVSIQRGLMVIAAAGVFRRAFDSPSKENEISPCLRENGSAAEERERRTNSSDTIFFIGWKPEKWTGSKVENVFLFILA